MPALIVTTAGTRVSLVSERLRVEQLPETGADAPEPRDIPLVDIEQVVISEGSHLTTAAVIELLKREIPVLYTTWTDRVIGLCVPPQRHNPARLRQYERSLDPSFALALACLWVEAKILNSRRVLQRLAANRSEVEVTPDLLALSRFAAQCQCVRSLDTLRGIEGTAAGRYFETFGSFFPETVPFERRSRRPPHNPPNAILSFAYTLLAGEAEAAILATGLDPALGFYHQAEYGRPSLALDLIEPFRAPLADAMAIDLINHQTVRPGSHFDNREGGIYLNTDGRKRFFVAYERRMEREFTSEQHSRRTSLRRELRSQAVAIKQSVVDAIPFEPFLMN